MPVCLKSGIIAKPLYIRIYKCVFRFVVAMCKLCNFFEFLSFKITELLPFLGYLIPILPHNLIIWHTHMTICHACTPVTRCWSDMPAHWWRCCYDVARLVTGQTRAPREAIHSGGVTSFTCIASRGRFIPYINMCKTSFNKKIDNDIIQINEK